MDASKFRAVVFQPLPDADGMSRSRTVPLPGATGKDAAWRKLFAALTQDRSLIGGTIEMVARC